MALPSGNFSNNNTEFIIQTGALLKDADEVSRLVVAVKGGRPIYLKDVAQISDGPEEPSQYVFMGFGPAGRKDQTGLYEAVTISMAKKKGTNATHIAERARKKIETLKGKVIPSGVEVTTTRNYGETAKDKSDELLKHMLLAAISVTLLIALALGWRESIVVAVAVPVTLALTILVTYAYGYTLNRVTLFALIFSIGILVDDAIVVVENIHRHFKMRRVDPEIAVLAVDEVEILPSWPPLPSLPPFCPWPSSPDSMGPYMRPIPVGASAAMLLSLLIAFIVSPWLSYIVLKKTKAKQEGEKKEGWLFEKFNRIYEGNIRGLLNYKKKRLRFYILIGALLLSAFLLVPLKLTTVEDATLRQQKRTPGGDRHAGGPSLEETAAVSREISEYLRTVPEVTHYQSYVGTAAPINFNGLVRHYFLRCGGNVADIQVNFVSKDERKTQSHEIAKRIRPAIKAIGDRYGARVKIVEIPPGSSGPEHPRGRGLWP